MGKKEMFLDFGFDVLNMNIKYWREIVIVAVIIYKWPVIKEGIQRVTE